MSLLVICEILDHFLNKLTADDNYSFHNSEIFVQPSQLQLSKRQKTFSQFFAPFLKFPLNFEHFEKKDDPHSLCIFGKAHCERRGYTMTKKPHFRTPFNSEHVNGSQTLVKPA